MKITGATLASLGVAFNAAYQGGLGQVESQASRIATTITSTTGKNEYGWLGKFPKMREWLGDRVINKAMASAYAISNKDWELTIEVDRNDIEDDNIGIYTPLFTEMGMATAAHPDELVYGLLQAGDSTLCYDGQYFFDTDHPVLDANGAAQSVSNHGGGASTPWYLIDDTRALKPIIFQERKKPQFVAMDKPDDPNVFDRKAFKYGVDSRDNVGFGFWQFAYMSKQDLAPDNYGTARAAMRNMTGDFGRKLGIKPTLLVVPPSLEKKALQILNAQQDAAGASNVWQGTAKLLVCDWLA